jgi:flagellar hook assembly protein FlgD
LGGRTVKELSRQTAAAGATSLAWDGRDQQGRLVPAGTYVVEATAWSANGALSRAVQTVTIR